MMGANISTKTIRETFIANRPKNMEDSRAGLLFDQWLNEQRMGRWLPSALGIERRDAGGRRATDDEQADRSDLTRLNAAVGLLDSADEILRPLERKYLHDAADSLAFQGVRDRLSEVRVQTALFASKERQLNREAR